MYMPGKNGSQCSSAIDYYFSHQALKVVLAYFPSNQGSFDAYEVSGRQHDCESIMM
jgi:hypothetical protein